MIIDNSYTNILQFMNILLVISILIHAIVIVSIRSSPSVPNYSMYLYQRSLFLLPKLNVSAYLALLNRELHQEHILSSFHLCLHK